MDEEEGSHTMVLDIGEITMRAGMSDWESPFIDCATIVGRPRHTNNFFNSDKSAYVGEEAESKRGILNLSRPISQAAVLNWADMQEIYSHLFSTRLGAPLAVLSAVSPLRESKDTEKEAELMFETFGIQSYCAVSSPVCALAGFGKQTGVFLSTAASTYSCAVYEGCILPHTLAVSKDLNEQKLIEYVRVILTDRGYDFNSASELNILKVAMDAKEGKEFFWELQSSWGYSFYEERFRAGEGLIHPEILGLEGQKGIPDLIRESISKVPEKESDAQIPSSPSLFDSLPCEITEHVQRYIPKPLLFQQMMREAVVCTGGNCCLRGFNERMAVELPDCKILTMEGYRAPLYAIYSGARLLAESPHFPSRCITRKEYDEIGCSNVVKQKCFA